MKTIPLANKRVNYRFDQFLSEALRTRLSSSIDWQLPVQTLAESLQEAVVSFSHTGEIVFWNKGAEKLTDYPVEEILGQNISRVIPVPLRRRPQNPQPQKPGDNELLETVLVKKDGQQVPVEISLYRAKNKNQTFDTAFIRDRGPSTRLKKVTTDYLKELEFLYSSSSQLLERTSYEDLYEFVAYKTASLLNQAVVIVNEYRPSQKITITRSVVGQKNIMAKVRKILGREPVGLEYHFVENTRQRMLAGKLVEVTGGLRDLTFGQMPQRLCQKLEKELNLGKIYAMPFVLENDFLGTLAILTTAEHPLVNEKIIETFVTQAAIVLKRKKTEDLLRESEERFRAVFENAAIGIVLADLKGHPLETNPTFEQMLGYNKSELRKMEFLDFTHPEDKKLDLEDFQTMKKGEKESYHLEKRYLKKSGEIVWVRLTVSLIKDRGGLPQFTIGVIQDITEQKTAEEELSQSRERFQRIFFESPIGIVLYDQDGSLVEANHAFMDIYGFGNLEQAKKANFFKSSNIPEEIKLKAKKGQNLNFEIDYDFQKARENDHYPLSKTETANLEITVTPLKKGKQIPFAYLVQVHDISERKDLEQRKEDFISIASHELKTPLTSIKAFTQLLQRRFGQSREAETLHVLGRMDAQVNKLTELINELLDVTKIQSGKLMLKRDRYSFDRLVKEVADDIQTITGQRPEIIIEGKTGQRFLFDRYRISQALVNLLNNAIRYSPGADKVIIRLFSTKDKVQIDIQDFGVGIGDEEQKHIFERFYRIGGDQRESGGLGLGLYITAAFVRQHGGQIWVRSTVGQGSTFSFSLPLKTKTSKNE